MPLFNNWPYINLSNLNLNWIISKITTIERVEKTVTDLSQNLPEYAATAESAANAASTAAEAANSATEQAQTLASQVSADADRAMNAADDAEVYKDAAAASNTAAGTALTAAQAAAAAAEQHAEEARAAENAAYTSANGAAIDANTAGNKAQEAAAAALRAESAASSEGFTGTGGTVTAGAVADFLLGNGSYLLAYSCADESSSCGLFFVKKRASGTWTFRSKNLTYTGSSLVIMISEVNGLLRVRNQSQADLEWMLVGYTTDPQNK